MNHHHQSITRTVLVCLLFGWGAVFAQSKKGYSFTLEEAIAHAQQNNYSAINANRDVTIALKKKWETTSIGLPQLNAGVNYQNNIELAKSVIPAQFFGGQPGEFATVAFGTRHSMNASATLSQLLFDGSYLVGLQAAKTYLKISEQAKVKTANEIREMVINAYGNVLLADESIGILQKNKAILEKVLSDTQQILKNGLTEEENVEQLQITLGSVNSSLENVKRSKIIASQLLKLILGIDLDEPIELKDRLNQIATQHMDMALSQSNFEVKGNIDYQIGQNALEAKKLMVKLEKSKALPSLAANATFGYNSFGDTFTFANSNQKWNNFSFIGMGLNIPIFSSLGRSMRTQQAQLSFEQAKTQLTETEQRLKLQWAKAKSDFEFSVQQWGTAKNNLALAERIENKQQIKFREGLSTSFDFTDAQRQLYTAQQNVLQTMIDVINKRAALEKLAGTNK